MRALSIAFIVPNGEHSEGFFPDTLLAQLCAGARAAGHRAEVVRVYYDGRDAALDAGLRCRLEGWLADRDVDLVVCERLFDPEPVVRHKAARPGRRCVLVSRGDSFDPVDGVDFVVGGNPGVTRTGATRRTPAIVELAWAFERLLSAIASGEADPRVPGVPPVVDGELAEVAPIERPPAPRPFAAVVEQDVLSVHAAPAVTRKTLFGNVGCPFADDPLKTPHHRGLTLPALVPVARLGCAFCSLGGDYEKRPDAQVVRELVEQALFWTTRVDTVTELVLNDQHSLRYLAALVRDANAAGVRPVRWLFAARADSFVRERARIEAAVAAAREAGHLLEVYLTGFEAFSDEELRRYNKGVDVDELVEAVREMRRLAIEQPASFAYSQARGHSLILWNPWTTPRNLAESADNIRAHGLAEAFHEIGRNRLRLYRDLPIFYAAQRDGALTGSWDAGDEGAGRRKGYSVEHPWRFLDGRTRVAYELAKRLRERLRLGTELAQLRAVAALTETLDPATVDVDATCRDVLAGIESLETALRRLGPNRAPDAPAIGGGPRAATVLFAGGCNNGCDACSNRDRWLDDRAEALRERVRAARAEGHPIALAGREPTLHPAFTELVGLARGDDGRAVGVVTNGRRFASAAFTRDALAAGLSAASVKLFAPRDAAADTISRDPGGHAQTIAGLRRLRAAGLEALELRAPVNAGNLSEFRGFADLAATLGVGRIRLEAAVDAIGLTKLGAAADAIDRLAARCAKLGVALDASPLDAGTVLFNRIPGGRGGARS